MHKQMRDLHDGNQSSPLLRLAGGLVSSAAIFAYCSIWIWQGLDFTDEGYNLTQQVLSHQIDSEYSYRKVWLSDLVGGMWLKLVDSETLIAGRLGWAAILALTGFLSYWTISDFASPLRAALITTAAPIAACYRTSSVITYNYVAGLFLVGASLFLLISHKRRVSTIASILAANVSGVFLCLGVMAKFPLILAVVFPAIPPLIDFWCDRRLNRRSLLISFVTWFASAVTFGCVVAWLDHVGHLSDYLSMFSGGGTWIESSESRAIPHLLKLAIRTSMIGMERTVPLLMIAGTLAWFIGRSFQGRQSHRSACVRYFFALTGLSGIAFWILGSIEAIDTYDSTLIGTTLIAGLSCLLAVRYSVPQEDRSIEFLQLIAIALLMPVVTMAGSENGFIQMRYGLWLLFSVVLLCSENIIPAAMEKWIAWKIDTDVLRRYLFSFLAALVLFGAWGRFVSTHRDMHNRFQLTAQVDYPELSRIYTSRARAASVAELLHETESRVAAGENLLVYNNAPMVYFLTHTRPVLGRPWLMILNLKSLSGRVAELGRSRPLPKLVIRAKVDIRDNANWAVENSLPIDLVDIPKLDLLDKTVEDLGYREVWSNEEFVILSR